MAMNSQFPSAFICTLVLAISLHSLAVSATNTAYPSIPGTVAVDRPLSSDGDLIPPIREVYDHGRIFDITHKYTPDLPVWDSSDGLGRHFLWLDKSIKNGSRSNTSAFKLGVHTGTHVDSPGHFFDNYLDAGFDINSLDLGVLNGMNVYGLCSPLCFILFSLSFSFSSGDDFFFYIYVSRSNFLGCHWGDVC